MVCLETSFLVDFVRGIEKAKSLIQDIRKNREVISITTPTIMELISGAEFELKGNEKKEIIKLIDSSIILPFDKESSILAGEIEASLIMAGEIIPVIDIMIASIVIKNNETLVTRNKKHFEKIENLKLQTY